MVVKNLICKNIKIIFTGFITDKLLYDNIKSRGVKKNGYIILRVRNPFFHKKFKKNIIFTFYQSSKQIINVTSIGSKQEMLYVKRFIKSIGYNFKSCKINNSLFSGKIKKNTISNLCKYLKLNPFNGYYYKKTHVFPGIFYKKQNNPTGILFSTGKILILGGCNIKKVKALYDYFYSIPFF